MPRRRASALIRWLIVAVVLLAAAGVGLAALAYLRPSVSVTEVVEGPVVEAFYATGTLQPDREYPIRASSAGVLQKPPGDAPYVDKGTRVSAGQPLAVMADAQWQAGLDKTKAELEERRKRADDATSPVLQELDAKIAAMAEQVEIAKREQQRIIGLLSSGGASQSQLDQSLNRVKATTMDLESFKAQKSAMKLQVQRELEVAEAGLKAAQWDVDLQTLRSPVDGVVLDRPAPLGTRLGVNDHVMQVADVRPERLVMRAQVDEEYVTRANPGQVVRMVLYAFPGESFEGKVAKIYDKADPDRRTFEVDVAPVAPDPRFQPGMTGELAFEVKNKPRALIVPSQSVQDGKVWLVRQGHVHPIDASVGVKGVEKTELTAGVQTGDRVLISPAGGLRDGQAVREQFMPAADAAALNKPKAKEVFRGGF